MAAAASPPPPPPSRTAVQRPPPPPRSSPPPEREIKKLAALARQEATLAAEIRTSNAQLAALKSRLWESEQAAEQRTRALASQLSAHQHGAADAKEQLVRNTALIHRYQELLAELCHGVDALAETARLAAAHPNFGSVPNLRSVRQLYTADADAATAAATGLGGGRRASYASAMAAGSGGSGSDTMRRGEVREGAERW